MIFGVSFDPVEANAKFAAKYDFPFLLLSDPGREMGVAYGAAADTSAPTARRISYLIGSDRAVLKTYAQVSPKQHPGEVLADIAEHLSG